MVLSYRFPIRQNAYEMADLTIFHHASTGFLTLRFMYFKVSY